MRSYLLRYGTKLYWRLRLAKGRVKVDIPITVQRHVPYAGRLRKSHKLDIYRPKNVSGALPVILFVHGGGFIMGDKHERRDICRELAAQNFIVFSINYRLSPEHRFPAGSIDTLRAMEWVKKHAAEYNGDPQNINIIGDSSGAHIAAIAVAATTRPELRAAWGVTFPVTCAVKKVVLYYGFYNLRDTATIKRKYFKTYIKAYTGTTEFEHYKYLDAFSPTEFVQPHHPPTLLIAGQADPLCTQTIDFANKLGAAGVHCNLLIFDKTDYPEALHGFLADAKTPAARQAFAAVCNFLQDTTANIRTVS